MLTPEQKAHELTMLHLSKVTHPNPIAIANEYKRIYQQIIQILKQP